MPPAKPFNIVDPLLQLSIPESPMADPAPEPAPSTPSTPSQTTPSHTEPDSFTSPVSASTDASSHSRLEGKGPGSLKVALSWQLLTLQVSGLQHGAPGAEPTPRPLATAQLQGLLIEVGKVSKGGVYAQAHIAGLLLRDERPERPEALRGVLVPLEGEVCGGGWGLARVWPRVAVRGSFYAQSRLFRPVFPDGQDNRDNHCSPRHRTAQIPTQFKNSENESKRTMFHAENARLLSESAVSALWTDASLVLVVFRVVTLGAVQKRPLCPSVWLSV